MQRRCLHPLSKCNHWGVMKFSNASRNDHVIIQGNISKGGHGIKVGDYAEVGMYVITIKKYNII